MYTSGFPPTKVSLLVVAKLLALWTQTANTCNRWVPQNQNIAPFLQHCGVIEIGQETVFNNRPNVEVAVLHPQCTVWQTRVPQLGC